MVTKGQRKAFTLEWNIVRKSSAYKPGNSMCCLCLDEKLDILDCYDDPQTVNKENMIQIPCRHRYQYRINIWGDIN